MTDADRELAPQKRLAEEQMRDAEREERRSFDHGASGARADEAAGRAEEERGPVEPLRPGEKVDQLAERAAQTGDRQQALLDQSVEETFPASDPIAPKRVN